MILNISLINVGLTSTKVVSSKMASCFWLTFAILFLLLVCRAGHARNNSASSKARSGRNINMTTLNLTNASAFCTLKKNESAIKDILRLMDSYTTKVVEIRVLISSGNSTQNLPEFVWPWASEIGRTLITLIERYKVFVSECASPRAFRSVGIKQLDVVFSEENYGCLLNGSEISELVFDFLLHQLSHSDDTHDYKLCRAFSSETDLKRYNCCRITGDNKLTICAEYSSIAVTTGEMAIFALLNLTIFLCIPLINYFLRGFPDECENYSIADSPLALSTIFRILFIDGNGLVKSAFRRFVFWLTIALILFFISTCLISRIITFSLIIPFTCVDIFPMRPTDFYNAYIETITTPFSAKFWWKIVKSKYLACQTSCAKFCFFLSLLLFPLVVILVALFNFYTLLWVVFFYAPRMYQQPIQLLVVLLRFLASLELIYFTLNVIPAMVLFIVTVYLNAEYYGPMVLFVTSLIVYCFQHWKSFVEAKYLVLKTNIYEISQIKGGPVVPLEASNKDPQQKIFIVDVNTDEIPKALYHTIRKKILPYDGVLLYFFIRMFFVGIFYTILYVLILFAQKSNISTSAQIISSLILTTLPFTFDTVLAEDTFEQKDANSKDQQYKIRQMCVQQWTDDNKTAISVKTDREEEIAINGNFVKFLMAINPTFGIWKQKR